MQEANVSGNVTNNINIAITDIEMFALLGQKDCEIFVKDKTIERLNIQFEKIKSVLVELETVKKKNSELELSNKQYSDNNIKLDRALTEERQKLKNAQDEIDKLKAEIGELNVKHNKSKKRSSS